MRKQMDAILTLTFVELTWKEGRVEQWIRFGHPVCEERLDPHRRRFGFAPGSIFGGQPLGGEHLRHGPLAL